MRLTVLAALALGCTDAPNGNSLGPGGDGTPVLGGADLSCTIPTSLLIDGGPGVDGIPALHNPTLVESDHAGAGYLRDDDRVIGLFIDGQPIAVPLNIGWWHEIVNLDMGGSKLAVTHCPLTGSSLTFVRSGAEFATLGVSGLLFMNNLVMYDRNAEPSLWPQMSRGARCGPRTATPLPMEASLEITWDRWKTLFPDTRVVSASTGFSRDYQDYPYDNYDRPWSPPFSPVPGGTDKRRPTKERVLGIPAADSAGIALPFGVLDSLGAVAVALVQADTAMAVEFWDRAGRAAMAYHPRTATQELTFRVESGSIVDVETRSMWRIDGVATSGPLSGTELQPVVEAFVAYWFAWAAFHPHTRLWLGPEDES